MKSVLSVFILLQCIINVVGQAFTDTMYFNVAWEQTTKENAEYYRTITADNSGDFLFHVMDFYINGQIQMTGTYRSIRPDNREGKFTWFYQNGQKQQECEYSNNFLNGLFQEWYDNGQLKSRQNFYEDVLDGPVKNWARDGKIQKDAQYNKGEKHGYFITYYDNGQKIRKDLYEYDVLIEGQCFNRDGTTTEYFPYVVLPRFKGGPPGLKKFIMKNLKYPKIAEKHGIEGTVLVLFTVDETGHVKDPQIVQGIHNIFNEEALRLVTSFPPWIPGMIDGVNATLQVTVPIDFRLR